MGGVHKLDFDEPAEMRTPEKTRAELVRVGNTTVSRLTLQSGWQWSECIKPIVGTVSCQVRHVGVVQAGAMHVVHDDGTEEDLGPGDAYVIEPGHDAWVVGDEPFVGFEFESRSPEEVRPRVARSSGHTLGRSYDSREEEWCSFALSGSLG
jgi:hypothetical protein